MWDQKNGKFPWKPGTPIFKCKTKECATNGGVIWEPKNGAPAPTATPPKSAPPKQAINHSNVPDSQLPEFLRSQESEDNAALAAKLGVDLSGIEKQLAVYQAVAEWTTKTLPGIFSAGKDAVGMTPESLAACTNTIFINAAKK